MYVGMYSLQVSASVDEEEGLSMQMDLFCFKETERRTVQAVVVCSRAHGGAINAKKIVTRFKLEVPCCHLPLCWVGRWIAGRLECA